jgi:hypothetical protein
MVQVWMVFLKNVKFNQSIINIYFAPYIYIFICKLIIIKKNKIFNILPKIVYISYSNNKANDNEIFLSYFYVNTLTYMNSFPFQNGLLWL